MKPHELVASFSAAVAAGDPMASARATLEMLQDRVTEIAIRPGSILGMRADTAHAVECVGSAPTIGLHVYGGDIFELPRRMWHPQTLEAHPLDWTLYESFARLASEAPAAPSP